MYQSNCDDVQTDQSLDLSYFLQINALGKQNKSHAQKKTLLHVCEAEDLSNAQADLNLRHSHMLKVSFSWYMYSPIRPV